MRNPHSGNQRDKSYYRIESDAMIFSRSDEAGENRVDLPDIIKGFNFGDLAALDLLQQSMD